jgi:hypothetical protein
MNEKRMPLTNEEFKHKKKSKSKGKPRADHKHIYETVLLIRNYQAVDYNTGKLETTQYMLPTKVCTICGRINGFDNDPSYYIKSPVLNLPFLLWDKTLSENALNLPKWYVNDFDKFAVKVDD